MTSRGCSVLACILIVLAGCNRDKSRASRNELPRDTALTNDLRKATAGSSAYGDAADIALAPIPDSELDRPARPVRLRVVATPSAPRIPQPAPAEAQAPLRLPERAVVRVPERAPDRAPARAPQQVSEQPATAATTNACDSPTAADQRRCLMSWLSRSDVGLDRTYQSLISALDRQAGIGPGDAPPATVQQLRQAQRAWLVYRDTECRRRNRGSEGPLWAPIRARCLCEFSHEREQELADALGRLGGR